MKKNLAKIIIPTLDSTYADDRDFLEAEIYEGKLDNEVKVPTPPKCFLGAWYRKVFSAKDSWLGIEGVITLGEFISDPKRFGNDGRVVYDRDLDSPSIYMGGFALSESDAGLGLMNGYRFEGDTQDINYGTPKIAYRPFWRYIYKSMTDNKGNVDRLNINSWNITDPNLFDFYYFPGDKIKMSVFSPMKDYLQLRIEMIEQTTIEKYKKIREGFNLKRINRTFYSPLFHSEGHGSDIPAEFKRVNSIDQLGNEGLYAKDTNAKVTKAVWENTYLFRNVNGKIVKVPFTEDRQATMACPNPESFITKSLKNGGEEITLQPSPIKKGE